MIFDVVSSNLTWVMILGVHPGLKANLYGSVSATQSKH
jgi:hypothetical protein